MTAEIRLLTAEALDARRDALAALLLDAVAGGASVGFLAATTHAEAAAWWEALRPSVADGSRLLWTADDEAGRTLGTVALVREGKPNGAHRAELVKLLVHRDARGAGLGRRLLAVAEQAARDAGATLLLLDTQTGSPAEHLYRTGGWTAFGTVPGHAATPDGVLAHTTYYYKQL
ncbi:GNAT family N-acetyltransferase [Streptomyces sp. TLI_171]|uniref:GNAT family N-acetyltransferase n=1 Tax=Streptomyces sp. TLI_171 TaxID=1938859 RepID=UPI000C19B3E7|nr:GNAT family N-acetyltransferase [Streptomyces sp. TLI_171]RKE20009.1 acetyltransferase (GNAT) family protein [Streptomyces sp. TLI_171]